MKVIFATVPIPATERLDDGGSRNGVAIFEARAYGHGEPGYISRSGESFPSPGKWLAHVNASDRVLIDPPWRHPEWPAIEVPASVLRALAGDDGVVMEWIWRPTR